LQLFDHRRSNRPMKAGDLAHSESRFVLGMRVDGTSYPAATALITRWAIQGESRYVCEALVAMVMEAHDCRDYQAVINGADLVTPGGMPIVWMLRRLGLRGQARVYGPELTLHVCEAAARQGLPVGFYGGTKTVLALLVERLRQRYPGLRIVYAYSPPFRAPTPAEESGAIADIRQSECRILFVGLGCPKQERWMARHRGAVPAVMVGVGAAFDFISGTKPQAPHWMQPLGLEWLFRLGTEPRRLWVRYAWHNPRFVALAAWQLIRTRWRNQPRKPRAEQIPPDAGAQSDRAWEGIDIQGLERSLRQKRAQLIAKRVLDWAGAAAVLLALAPVFLLIALLVRFSSQGPAIFRQSRVGYRETAFVMYKFRSMRTEPDLSIASAQQATAAYGMLLKREDDPRVTPIGRFLRSTSLDELPQLLNVLKSDMSFVGPRPLVPFMLEPYPEFRKARALVRPGITGLWQVRDRERNTSAVPMMPHDLEYLRRFSLKLDLGILLRTLFVVGSRKGAC
jgi:N-acetylglucosaminyldiphosphoundecaprenol N-acetyl-beta-D-mannosaminyltransferase